MRHSSSHLFCFGKEESSGINLAASTSQYGKTADVKVQNTNDCSANTGGCSKEYCGGEAKSLFVIHMALERQYETQVRSCYSRMFCVCRNAEVR